MENIEMLDPWIEIEVDKRKLYEDQLEKEIQPKHLLYQVKVNAVAQHRGCDDVLFSLVNHVHAFAVVHLTYASASSQVSPEWPHTQFYNSIEDWVENCMKVDHQDYQ